MSSPPIAARQSPLGWARRNLFRSRWDAAVTVVAAVLVGYAVVRAVRFVFVTGRWEIVRVNLKLLMVGRFPDQHLLRVSVAVVVAAGVGGLVAGCLHRRQADAGRLVWRPPGAVWAIRAFVARSWPLLLVTLLVLSLTSTPGPWVTAGAALAALVVARLLGTRLPKQLHAVIFVGAALAPFLLVWYLADAVGWDGWGGLMLNVFIAVTSIVLCFPLGVLAALGRRSSMPVVRGLSTVTIELVRGAPLFVLLLMANVALGFFVPPDQAPGRVARAIVVFTIFTAAYLAEIVRGGLQSLPPGQEEAAKALGLSPVRVTFLVVLPQALRNVIPAQVGQFISLFKDTTLAGAAMTLFELLQVGQSVTAQGPFAGQALLPEAFAFVGLLFWTGAYTMSRESQRLERRLGVGQR